jgi:CRISPR/Cas system CSM-associated protein Csm3 (group 7 of RAMP superfamily)
MRKLAGRLLVEARLRLQTPLHIGGAAADVRTDLPLTEDGQGRIYVPGTSLAGALRAWCLSSFPAPDVDSIWGPAPEHREGSGAASYVLIEDAAVPGDAAIEIRDHVGLARDHGAAAAGIKFDRAVLPRGTALGLEMTWELPRNGQRAKLAQEMLFALLGALRRGEVRLGAAKSRGLGRITLDGEPAIRSQDFLSRQGILAALRRRGSRPHSSPCQTPLRSPRIEIEIDWRPEGPVMVKSGYDGIAVDALPLVTADGEKISPVLPGSGLKGALRAQAERILRTVLGADAPASDSKRTSFLEQLGDPRLGLVQELFGAAGERARDGDSPKPGPGASVLLVDDVLLRKPLSRGGWETIENATEPRTATANIGDIAFESACHVAVDRWTGGAAEHLLFATLELHPCGSGSPWEPMRLTLLPNRLRGPGPGAALALLLLTLRDLARGLISIGFAGNRGMGVIRVEAIRYRGSGDLPQMLEPLTGEHEDTGEWANLPAGFIDELREAWRKYISENRSKFREPIVSA